MDYLNRIFTTKNIPFTIGWIIGIGLSMIVLISISPDDEFYDIFNLPWLIAQPFGLLMWLTILSYWDEIITYIMKIIYNFKPNCINIYNRFKQWLYE